MRFQMRYYSSRDMNNCNDSLQNKQLNSKWIESGICKSSSAITQITIAIWQSKFCYRSQQKNTFVNNYGYGPNGFGPNNGGFGSFGFWREKFQNRSSNHI